MSGASSAELSPTLRLRHTAADAWRSRDFETYFRLMREAARLSPDDVRLLIDLGAAHGARMEFADAARCFDGAVAASSDRAATLAAVGLQSRNCLRYDWAEKYLALAAAEPGADAATLAKLAEMSERLRRTDAASAAVDRALWIDPRSELALLVRGRLHRSAGRLVDGERDVRDVLARTDPDGWSTRIRAGYELAANLDRQGRYDEAIAALAAAKAEIIPNATGAFAEQQLVQRRLREIAAGLTSARMKKWATAAAADGQRRPVAVLAGHPRSGTTLLEQLLDAHPSAVSAEETPIFFETYLHLRRTFPPAVGMVGVLDGSSPAAVRQARGGYFRMIDAFLEATGTPAGPGKTLIDKNPSLTSMVPALVRVLPDVRLIVALRDPRDVCLSCYMQPLPINPVSSAYLTLERTVDEYCSVMAFWLAVKPLLPVPALQVKYEDVVDDVRGQAEKTLRFLGLDWDERVAKFDERARQKLVRSPTYAEVARPVSRGAVGRWQRYRTHLEPVLAKLAPFVRAFGYPME
jgi:tetratricopeptide (TPR) repeat protein